MSDGKRVVFEFRCPTPEPLPDQEVLRWLGYSQVGKDLSRVCGVNVPFADGAVVNPFACTVNYVPA